MSTGLSRVRVESGRTLEICSATYLGVKGLFSQSSKNSPSVDEVVRVSRRVGLFWEEEGILSAGKVMRFPQVGGRLLLVCFNYLFLNYLNGEPV